jgi:hypothetical protein
VSANAAYRKFAEHSEERGQFLRGARHYHHARTHEERERLEEEYERWDAHCSHLVCEMTRAANWLADVVRNEMNPRFFSTEGRFSLVYTGDNLDIVTEVPEYTAEQRQQLPSPFQRTPIEQAS